MLLLLLVIIIAFVFLLKPVFTPTIERASDDEDNPQDKLTVLLAGSFNPPHIGHLALLRNLSRRHKKVIAVIGVNPSKTYSVSPQQRVELLQAMVGHAGLTNISVVAVSGYIWRYAMEQSVDVMYRGIRTWAQDGTSETWMHVQNQLGPVMLALKWPIPTRLLQGAPSLSHVSSTCVRKLCKDNGNLQGQVPDGVCGQLKALYG